MGEGGGESGDEVPDSFTAAQRRSGCGPGPDIARRGVLALPVEVVDEPADGLTTAAGGDLEPVQRVVQHLGLVAGQELGLGGVDEDAVRSVPVRGLAQLFAGTRLVQRPAGGAEALDVRDHPMNLGSGRTDKGRA